MQAVEKYPPAINVLTSMSYGGVKIYDHVHGDMTNRCNPFIRDRVLSVNTLILNGNGDRRLFVHPKCAGVLKGLEQQAYDQGTQQPEKGDGGIDDLSGQMDALGYACWQLAGIKSWRVGKSKARVGQIW